MTVSDSKPRQVKATTGHPARDVFATPRPAGARYADDFARWAFEQAMLLRDGAFGELDIENIAEELETLGRDEFNKLESIVAVIVTHMLKWDHQPERRSRSWAISISVQRRHAARQIKDNPSLKPRLGEALAEAHETARLTAANETGLPLRVFPTDCPYSWQDVTDRPFAIDPDDA